MKISTEKPLTGMHILVVEDHLSFLMVLTYTLQQAGGIVTPAPDGNTAYDLLTSTPFDLLLSEYHLPGCTGDILCRVARQVGTPRTVLMSCSSQLSELAQECPVDATYQKGGSLHNLVTLLANMTSPPC